KDPLSSSGTLSSMKNMDDTYTFGDQFLNDKSTEDEPGKLNVEVEVVSMVTILIYQVDTSIPPLSTPIIEILSPRSSSPLVHAPIITATTVTTSTTLALPPPPPTQSITNPYFRDLSEIEMKEMIQQRMFKSGSYKSLPEYRPSSFSPPKDTDQRKRKKQDSGASASQQPPVQTSFAWTTTDIRDTPSSSSKKQSVSHSEQPTNDIPTPDEGHISDSDDHDNAHVPKIKPRAEWLKPVSDDERPATPEPAWVIPTSHIPDVVNNWANALATTYQDPTENSLFENTEDMRTFMNWYCQKVGKTELTQANFEGQAYEVIKPFYPDVIHL
ncbi:hypothetical protein Tco_1358532, partial [Tanacetum coccineum]